MNSLNFFGVFSPYESFSSHDSNKFKFFYTRFSIMLHVRSFDIFISLFFLCFTKYIVKGKLTLNESSPKILYRLFFLFLDAGFNGLQKWIQNIRGCQEGGNCRQFRLQTCICLFVSPVVEEGMSKWVWLFQSATKFTILETI